MLRPKNLRVEPTDKYPTFNMGNLFGVRRRAPIVTAQDRAVLQLKQQRDKIKIYQKRTESDLASNKELALKLFQAGKKDRALILMRRKKCLEDVLSRTDKQLETLEQLVVDLEYTQIEVSVVEGLKVGSEALKQLNNLMNIDDIQQMMEDNEEAARKQQEISDILQKSSERYDEQDLLKELDSYIVKQEDDILAKAPDVPTDEPVVDQTPEPVSDATQDVDQVSEAKSKTRVQVQAS